jgi:hypothetical protein
VADERELHEINQVPNVLKLKEYGEKQKQVKAKIDEVTKVFRPDPDQISK